MVGALMDFDDVTVRAGRDARGRACAICAASNELPSQTDQLFVVDRGEQLLGVLPVDKLLVTDPDATVREVMAPAAVTLLQHAKADEAASSFERYDLVSAPVIDTNGKLVGRVTVDEILDFVREQRSTRSCWLRPACARRRTSSRRCGRRFAIAGRGWRSTS